MRRIRQWPQLWIAAVALVVYLPALGFGFTWFDDNLVILDQLGFLSDFGNLASAFREDVFRSPQEAYYRPLLTVSLMIDAHLGGASPAVYHGTNLLLHAAASCAVFRYRSSVGASV